MKPERAPGIGFLALLRASLFLLALTLVLAALAFGAWRTWEWLSL